MCVKSGNIFTPLHNICPIPLDSGTSDDIMWPLVNKKLRVVGRTLGEQTEEEAAGMEGSGAAGPSSAAAAGASPKGRGKSKGLSISLSSWQRVVEQRPEAEEPSGPDVGHNAGGVFAGDRGSPTIVASAGSAEADSDAGEVDSSDSDVVEVTGTRMGKHPRDEEDVEEEDGSSKLRRALNATQEGVPPPQQQSREPCVRTPIEVIEID